LKPARQNQLFEALLRAIAPPGGERPLAAPQADARKHVTVLVADDNAVNLKVACAMLVKLGYDFRTATNGREALEELSQATAEGRRFGAILMDVNMPEVDGLQATRQIHAAWGEQSPPIVALTAGASAEDRARCEAAGMDDYLTKPLQVSALAQALEKWVAEGQKRTSAPPREPEPAAPAPNAVNASALVDFSRLEEFKEFDDDELTMTREVIELFLADAPRRLEAIAQAVKAGDAGAIAAAAHALLGSARNIGAMALQEGADALEAAAKAGVPLDGAERHAALCDAWEKTRPLLSSWSPQR
jgi:CheY-like chemotaxis protein/HPt (histidine-containing phosphotransfer) domain-containing protein